MARHPAAVAVLALLLAASDAPAGSSLDPPLKPGDLLVLDASAARVLRVDPGTGLVDAFSPRTDTGTNLLASPAAIAVDPAGSVWIANGTSPNWLLSIDPATGVQADVVGSSGPPFVQSTPWGLTVRPLGDPLRPLYVSESGELGRVDRSTADITGANVAPYPSPFDDGFFPRIRERQGSLDVFLSIASGILLYDGKLDEIAPFFAATQGFITGLDYSADTDSLYFGWLYAACPSESSGLYLLDGDAHSHAVALGGDVGCPGAIAATTRARPASLDALPFPIYVIDRGSVPQRVIRVDGVSAATPLATLPDDADAADLAIYTPEPSANALAAAGALALGLASAMTRSPRNRTKRVR